jgi:hypothetical protein
MMKLIRKFISQDAFVLRMMDDGGGNSNSDNSPLLFDAIAKGELDNVKKLIESGVDLNPQDIYSKQTPIFDAIRNGNIEIVKALIIGGADLNHADLVGETPIFAAIRQGSEEIKDKLILGGADLNHKSNNGKTPLDIIPLDSEKVKLTEIVKLKELGKMIEASLKNVMPADFKIEFLKQKGSNKKRIGIQLDNKDIDILNLIKSKLTPDVSAFNFIKDDKENLVIDADIDLIKNKFDKNFLKSLSNEITEFRIDKLTKEWGKAGHLSKIQGNVFKLDSKSNEMGELITFCLHPDQSGKKVEAEALIKGIQKGILTKKAVVKALKSIGAPLDLQAKLEKLNNIKKSDVVQKQ